MKKKIFLVGILTVFFLTLVMGNFLVPRAQAQQEAWFEPSAETYEETLQRSAAEGEVSDLPWVSRILNGLGWSIVRILIGPLPRGGTSPQSYKPGGAVGGLVNMIAVLYRPPVSSTEYFADLGKNLGIVRPAYAQGFGFEALRSLLPLWKAFRNLAYLLFTIIFVAAGFAIMFRTRISPQAVATIQSSLPKIVVALILVTFSYAIAGLLIDMIYFLFFLVLYALQTFGGITSTEVEAMKETYTTGSLIQTLTELGTQGYRGLRDLLKAALPDWLRWLPIP